MIGKENLIVLRFDAESWRDGSIIHDFMHEIGIAAVTMDLKKTNEIQCQKINQQESIRWQMRWRSVCMQWERKR